MNDFIAPATLQPVHSTVGSADLAHMQMSYRRTGTVGGPTLLLLHGSFATGRWWQSLMTILPEEFDVIAPDLRGCGGTHWTGDDYAIRDQAADIAALIEALALDNLCVIGHAIGAAIAIETALALPGKVASLVLISPPPPEGVVTPPEGLAVLDAMRQDQALLRSALTLLAPVLAASGDPFFDELVEDASHMAAAAYAGSAIALGNWQCQDTRLLTLPSLLIWGDADPVVSRAMVTRMLISLPGAINLDILPEVGHAPMLDAALALAERIVDFATDDSSSYAAIRESASEL